MPKGFNVIIIVILFMCAHEARSTSFTEGVDYIRVATPERINRASPNIEVLEFFWYGCVHCYQLEEKIQAWATSQAGNVSLRQIPAVMKPNWAVHAKSYYAAQALGKVDIVHIPLFEALHDKKLHLNTKGALADFIAVKSDSDPVLIEQQMESIVAKRQILDDIALQKAYKIKGAPSIVVNGKYMTNGRYARSLDRLIQITDYLVQKELQSERIQKK